MRTILLCAAGALTLAACQQPAAPAETPAPAATDAGVDAAAPADAPSGAMAPASSHGSENDGVMAASSAPTDTAGAAPVSDGMSPTTQATRDMAKEKAEETNLHPRTP